MPHETNNRFLREPQTLEAWESWVDHLIVCAQERGDFDNLPGQGKPLKIEDTPYGGGREVGFGMMKSAGVAPFWIELEKELRGAEDGMSAALAQATALVCSQRAAHAPAAPATRTRPVLRRVWSFLFPHTDPPELADDRAGMRRVTLERLRQRYQESAETVERATRQYNAAIPRELWWLERPVRTVAAELIAWDDALAASASPG